MPMQNRLTQLGISIRRFMWSFLVAYMIGLHNFWKGEEKSVEDIRITVEIRETPGDSTPKD